MFQLEWRTARSAGEGYPSASRTPLGAPVRGLALARSKGGPIASAKNIVRMGK